MSDKKTFWLWVTRRQMDGTVIRPIEDESGGDAAQQLNELLSSFVKTTFLAKFTIARAQLEVERVTQTTPVPYAIQKLRSTGYLWTAVFPDKSGKIEALVASQSSGPPRPIRTLPIPNSEDVLDVQTYIPDIDDILADRKTSVIATDTVVVAAADVQAQAVTGTRGGLNDDAVHSHAQAMTTLPQTTGVLDEVVSVSEEATSHKVKKQNNKNSKGSKSVAPAVPDATIASPPSSTLVSATTAMDSSSSHRTEVVPSSVLLSSCATTPQSTAPPLPRISLLRHHQERLALLSMMQASDNDQQREAQQTVADDTLVLCPFEPVQHASIRAADMRQHLEQHHLTDCVTLVHAFVLFPAAAAVDEDNSLRTTAAAHKHEEDNEESVGNRRDAPSNRDSKQRDRERRGRRKRRRSTSSSSSRSSSVLSSDASRRRRDRRHSSSRSASHRRERHATYNNNNDKQFPADRRMSSGSTSSSTVLPHHVSSSIVEPPLPPVSQSPSSYPQSQITIGFAQQPPQQQQLHASNSNNFAAVPPPPAPGIKTVYFGSTTPVDGSLLRPALEQHFGPTSIVAMRDVAAKSCVFVEFTVDLIAYDALRLWGGGGGGNGMTNASPPLVLPNGQRLKCNWAKFNVSGSHNNNHISNNVMQTSTSSTPSSQMISSSHMQGGNPAPQQQQQRGYGGGGGGPLVAAVGHVPPPPPPPLPLGAVEGAAAHMHHQQQLMNAYPPVASPLGQHRHVMPSSVSGGGGVPPLGALQRMQDGSIVATPVVTQQQVSSIIPLGMTDNNNNLRSGPTSTIRRQSKVAVLHLHNNAAEVSKRNIFFETAPFGEVQSIQVFSQQRCALVTFREMESVQALIDYREHTPSEAQWLRSVSEGL